MLKDNNYGWKSADAPQSCDYLVPVILRLLTELQPSSVLDIGTGNGAMCRSLIDAGYKVAGIEPDEAGLDIARIHCGEAILLNMGIEDSPEALLAHFPARFDCVVSTEVVEHLYAPEHFAAFASACLKQGGHVVVSTPYHGYFKNIAIAATGMWDFHHDPLWTGGHIKFWSRKTLKNLFKSAGFHEVRFLGVGRFPYLWKSMVVVFKKG